MSSVPLLAVPVPVQCFPLCLRRLAHIEFRESNLCSLPHCPVSLPPCPFSPAFLPPAYTPVHRPREGVLDAQWLRGIAGANTVQAQQLSNNAKRFKMREFIAKLKDKFKPAGAQGIDWTALGKDAGVLFRTVPRMDFM